jgi:hypothetical protein
MINTDARRQTHARTPKWMQKWRWIAVTCWVAVGTKDDISHTVAVDDGSFVHVEDDGVVNLPPDGSTTVMRGSL